MYNNVRAIRLALNFAGQMYLEILSRKHVNSKRLTFIYKIDRFLEKASRSEAVILLLTEEEKILLQKICAAVVSPSSNAVQVILAKTPDEQSTQFNS